MNESFHPSVSILQLRLNDGNVYRKFLNLSSLNRLLNETPNCSNYELIYIRSLDSPLESDSARIALGEQLYREFNANAYRPRDYYGHSLSVSDIIVFSNNANEHSCYYVDSVGLKLLPENFLSPSVRNHIISGLDIRKEYQQLSESHTLSISNQERVSLIEDNYNFIFRMADIRGAIMDMEELGFTFLRDNKDQTTLWQKNDCSEPPFTLDSWDSVLDFVRDVQTLRNSHNFSELHAAMQNGGKFDPLLNRYGELAIQAAATQSIAASTLSSEDIEFEP